MNELFNLLNNNRPKNVCRSSHYVDGDHNILSKKNVLNEFYFILNFHPAVSVSQFPYSLYIFFFFTNKKQVPFLK